jgi:hypothetical protein
VPLDEFATEIEAQPRAPYALGECILRSCETTKEACLIMHRNADPMILDAQEYLVCSCLLMHRYLDGASVRTVFDGIAEQIGEHLLNASGVTMHYDLLHRWVEGEGMPLGGQLALCHDSSGEFDQVRLPTLQDEPPP